MNNNQEEINVSPYKATGNLNRTISNPSASINDAMNVNIQNVTTNNTQVVEPLPINTPPQQQSNTIPVTPSAQTNNINNQSIIEEALKKQTATNTINNNNINNKVYVNNENKPKKKKLTLSIGPEFKIALLIIVILLAFVLFILPLISNVR